MKKSFKYGLSFLMLLFFLSCENERNSDITEDMQQEYTCPMHPEIIRNTPGSCPICGMDLVKKETGNKTIDDLELEALLKPTDELVIASIPLTTVEQKDEDLELNVVGTIAYDRRQTGVISSRVSGRIERLFIRYLYQPVRKGQRVMEIYSPELLTAQQHLIFLLQNDAGNISLINAAKEKLLLLGVTPAQVARIMNTLKPQYSVTVFSNYDGYATNLNSSINSSTTDEMQVNPGTKGELSIKEGMYVQSGQAVLSIYDPSKAWILLDLFPEQQTLVKVGDPVRITPETSPGQNFRARIDYIEPIFRPGSKTMKARVYFNNSKMQLPIGSRITATVFPSSKTGFWLPSEAVLSLGREKIVFKKVAGGFRAHRIVAGLEWNRMTQVIDGLEITDSVAVNAQFLVDNEAFIKTGKQ